MTIYTVTLSRVSLREEGILNNSGCTFCTDGVDSLFVIFRSHFVSAKTDDLINTMFLRVTAEVVGVKLTNTDLERASTVVKADIMQYTDVDADEQRKPVSIKRTRSSFCVLQ